MDAHSSGSRVRRLLRLAYAKPTSKEHRDEKHRRHVADLPGPAYDAVVVILLVSVAVVYALL